jgi:CO dehydrogenase/acetyl-CoA synthase alpha subunit
MALPTARRWLAAVLLTAVVAIIPPSAAACSICRCGDPTFNALGTDIYKQGAFRVFLDCRHGLGCAAHLYL